MSFLGLTGLLRKGLTDKGAGTPVRGLPLLPLRGLGDRGLRPACMCEYQQQKKRNKKKGRKERKKERKQTVKQAVQRGGEGDDEKERKKGRKKTTGALKKKKKSK